MIPRTPPERRAVRQSFELMSVTLRLMVRELDLALQSLPNHHVKRPTIERERDRLAALSLVYDRLLDANVRR